MKAPSARRSEASLCLPPLLATLSVALYLIFYLTYEVSRGRYTKALSNVAEVGYVRDPAGNLPRGIGQQGNLPSRRGLLEGYVNLPLSFEPSHARGASEFFARGSRYAIALNARRATLMLQPSPMGAEQHFGRQHSRLSRGEGGSARTASVSFTLLGAKDVGRPVVLNELPGKSNYFVGNDPREWITNVPHYSRIQYKNVYPGIDLVYHRSQQQLESDFIVSPGTNPKIIRVAVDGSRRLERSEEGDLILQTAAGQVRLRKPSAYQLISNVPTEIASSFRWISEVEFGFEISAYDPTKTLIIDPVLAYSTYLGGGAGENGSDFGLSIAVDSAGSAYITGATVTTDFPTANPLQSTNHGALDVFITKLNSTGTGLVYSTYLGGSGDDWGLSISLDGAGNAYVAGTTVSQDFPTTSGAFNRTCTTTDQAGIVRADVFITKLDSTGSALAYSTCLGGTADDEGFAIAVDAQGNAYVAGGTKSADFPVTTGAFQTTFAGGDVSLAGYYDAFVTKINASGSALLYSTYLGGCDNDQANGIAVDSLGNAYVTGETKSASCLSAKFPTTPGSFQSQSSNIFGTVFVTKLNPSGSALVYSTFLGGYGEDSGNGIAVDPGGHAYVAGTTQSATFPSTPGAFQSQNPDILNSNGFISKLSADGTALVYSTYLGGEFIDGISSIAVDSVGNSYVTGTTYSGNFPFADPFPQPCVISPTGDGKVFVTKLNQAGSALAYSICVGGGGDSGNGIALDGANNASVSGTTFSSAFVTTPGAFQSVLRGSSDAFILKITEISSLSAATIDFGYQPLGITSTAQNTTLTNNGTSAITVGTASLSGANVADFEITSDTCTGQILAPGSNCSVGVAFTPTALGTRGATIILTDSAPDSPLNVDLGGSGVDFSIAGSPSMLTVSAGQQAAYSVAVTPEGGSISDSVSLTCSLPATLTFASCSLSPLSLSPGSNSGTSTLTVNTTAGGLGGVAHLPYSPPTERFLASTVVISTFGLAGIAFLVAVRRRGRIISEISAVILWIFFIQFVACGCGNAPPVQSGTPPGTYTITISGTFGSLKHTNTVTLVVSALFAKKEADSPLMQPALANSNLPLLLSLKRKMADAIQQTTERHSSPHAYPAWLDIECLNVHSAIGLMRTMVVTNVLSRREVITIFVPVNPQVDTDGDNVTRILSQLHRFAADRKLLSSVAPYESCEVSWELLRYVLGCEQAGGA